MVGMRGGSIVGVAAFRARAGTHVGASAGWMSAASVSYSFDKFRSNFDVFSIKLAQEMKPEECF